MAENIDVGRIEVLQNEVMTPVEVTQANLIQIPTFDWNQNEVIKVSKHGIVTDTWISLPQNTVIKMNPPFFILSRYECEIPAMVV